jgi:hypothetical protein
MKDILLHHPLVHLYVLYVAAWFLVYVWDFLCHPADTKTAAGRCEQRPPTNEVSFPPPADRETAPVSVGVGPTDG